MPYYEFECKRHGNYTLSQGINDEHKGKCPECRQVFSRFFFMGAGSEPVKMGKTRQELFDNLAKEDGADKNWKQYDTYYQRAVGGLDDKGNVGG